ncbi:ThiF family adenylyltransferase [Mucilaginibacter glaciei]|uniref:ThiF family adenylyltransferase n=1 Tax=Mucilaginibacter glaciei TaxID=2772109 RepID=A0A926NUV2_9SPHI|nr:ThiF family adenylyltransferase [Mucilaginibacter glaciei]MBD1395135.1 ThiF family adenylyltransferase [Mucilaginibacter glaciei]
MMKNNVFKYPDTNSARAKIEVFNEKFEGMKIAIIGLGGTGSYTLDLVSKTPVAEIHLFDGDIFQLHNAFRAPGATPAAKFESAPNLFKVDYYHETYSEMHGGIKPHAYYLTTDNLAELDGFDFVFISVDKNEVRHFLTTGLLKMGISFIDVGLGVNALNDNLVGTLRVTRGTAQKSDHLINRIGRDELKADEYATNIQIADLNCLNASLAVLSWKKHVGFYQDLKKEHNQLFFINTGRLLNEDFDA